jgi:transcriptional regulator with XRE-family HTH domain
MSRRSTPNTRPLGEVLRGILADRRVSQQSLADALGMTQQAIARMLVGEPKLSKLYEIETHLGLQHGHIARAAGYVDDVPSLADAIALAPDLSAANKDVLGKVYKALRTPPRSSNPGR